MKKYNNRGSNYRPKQRRKKIRINMTRLTIFIFSCLVILLGAGFGIKSLLTDKVDVNISMTDDLNPVEGESLFKVLLNWDPLTAEDYKHIQIKVNDKEYTLEPDLNQFEVELDNPNEAYEVTFMAKKKGLVISNTVKQVINTLADNARLEQSVSNLKIENDVLSFEHEIQRDSGIDFNIDSISYEALDVVNGISAEAKTEIIKQDKNAVMLKVTIPMGGFEDSPILSIKMDMLVQKALLSIPLRDMDMQVNQVSVDPFNLVFDKNSILLINNNIEHYNYVSHDFYAESLHLKLNTNDEISTYQLADSSGKVMNNEKYNSQGNQGIDLANLSEGQYFIKINELPVYLMNSLNETWYTVTRNGKSNKVTLQTKNAQLSLKVEKVDELPENVYDILIDPGHGGLDGGTVTGDLKESGEALKVSKYIAQRLEDHGLKVKLTRTEDLDPAGEGNFDYGKSPFFDEGRVEQAYRYQAKYMLSNHLNAFDGSLKGFEVYSSVATDDGWASGIVASLTDAGHSARDSLKSEFRVSEGSYKKYFLCKEATTYASTYGCSNDYMDYLYIIRETGGRISQSSELIDYNENYTTIPNYGAETILIEYAYLDNKSDYQKWVDHWENYGEAVVKATVEYLGMTYKK